MDESYLSTIAITAYSQTESQAKAAGYQLLLTKPILPLALVPMITDLIAEHAESSGQKVDDSTKVCPSV